MAETRAKSIDKRTVDRYVEKGQIKKSELESHLKALPDDTANADWVEMDLEEEEIGHDDGLDDEEEDMDSDDSTPENHTEEQT
jgi:hypothetical protein